MNDESLGQVEQQIASIRLDGSANALRSAVLADVSRELRAARWDRRLARIAAALLVVGVGMNLIFGLRSADMAVGQLVNAREDSSRKSLVDTAVVVAEATDASTARQIARQLAAMSGRKLSDDEAAAIDTAVRKAAGASRGNKG